MAFTTFDNAPYLYRKSGGGGDKEIDKLVGGTIAWNQLVQNGNFADTSGWFRLGSATLSIANNVATIDVTANFNGMTTSTNGDLFSGHKYLVKATIKASNQRTNSVGFGLSDGASNYQIRKVVSVGTDYTTFAFVGMQTQGYTSQRRFMVYDTQGANSPTVLSVKNCMAIDLTLMFGSTIADYVYSLEQSSQGSGLAWLRSYGFFTEDYYDYNSGELKSVSNLVSHDMTGKNLLPMTLANLKAIQSANGSWSGNTYTLYGVSYAVDTDDGGNVISITVNGTATQYSLFYLVGAISFPFDVRLSGCASGGSYSGYRLQAEGGTMRQDIGNGVQIPANEEKTRIIIVVPSGGAASNAVFKPMIRLSSVTDDTYEPYTLHSYPLGDVTLRGLPKLNGNALYYDGDTYESNGTVTRKYGVVDLGSLNWAYDSTNTVFQTSVGIVKTGTVGTPIICDKYVARPYGYNSSYSTEDKVIFVHASSGTLRIRDSSYTDASAFKTSLSGVYLVYELATTTTETADTYTNPQWVDPNGTEKYTLSSDAFPMPVGHETTYNTDMGSKTVNTQVNLSMTEPQVRQVYAKEGDTARVLNIHLDQTEEDGTLRILRPDGTEVTADAVLVPEFYDGLMAEIPSDATEIVGKCYCDVEQNGVSSMPFTLNVKKNERQ